MWRLKAGGFRKGFPKFFCTFAFQNMGFVDSGLAQILQSIFIYFCLNPSLRLAFFSNPARCN